MLACRSHSRQGLQPRRSPDEGGFAGRPSPVTWSAYAEPGVAGLPTEQQACGTTSGDSPRESEARALQQRSPAAQLGPAAACRRPTMPPRTSAGGRTGPDSRHRPRGRRSACSAQRPCQDGTGRRRRFSAAPPAARPRCREEPQAVADVQRSASQCQPSVSAHPASQRHAWYRGQCVRLNSGISAPVADKRRQPGSYHGRRQSFQHLQCQFARCQQPS